MAARRKPAAPSPDGVTRARGKAKKKLSKPERIQYITQLMAKGEWVRGVTGPQLAKRWGLSLKTIEQDSAESSRTIQSLFDDADKAQLKAEFLLELQSDKARCRKGKRFEALGRLQEIFGKAIGAFEAGKLQVTGKDGRPIDVNLSNVAELLALADGDDDTEPSEGETTS